MPKLEDITYSDDEDVAGAEADFNNLEFSIPVSPIPTTRIHKDHPVSQIIDGEEVDQQYVLFPVWSFSSTNPHNNDEDAAFDGKEHDFVAKKLESEVDVSLRDLNAEFEDCYDNSSNEEEPKRVYQALKDPSWIEAMNKKDEKGIVIRNKARLVTQGHTQEEGIDYEEVSALVARIEAIRLFLAYASFMGFMVYQMDVKSAFLYGTIEKEVYVGQLLGFEDPDHPDKVKQKKDRIFISQDKYAAEILRKFGLNEGKSASTLIDTDKPLLKDPDGEDVDVHIYRSMTGSLIYLTSSRPDI
nr:hypothetical protein [Tanacetum cinerariifolium]